MILCSEIYHVCQGLKQKQPLSGLTGHPTTSTQCSSGRDDGPGVPMGPLLLTVLGLSCSSLSLLAGHTHPAGCYPENINRVIPPRLCFLSPFWELWTMLKRQ